MNMVKTLEATVLLAAAAIAPILAMADSIARHADGSPIRVRVERKAAAPRRMLKAAGAEDVTSRLLAEWGVTNRVVELKERKRETDCYGRTHIRYRQLYKGIEVDERELIVHEKGGEVYEVNGEFLAGLELGVEPVRQVAGGKLVVWCKGRKARDAHLAWRVNRAVKGRRYWDFIDDKTGEVLQTRRAGAAAKITDDDPGDDEEETEDEYIKQIDTAKLERAAVDKPYPEGAPVTITGNLPWQMGGEEVSVEGIELDGKKYLACTNKYGVEYCVYDGFCAPCYTNELAGLLARIKEEGDADAVVELQDWFRDFTNKVNFTAYNNYDSNIDGAKDAIAIAYNIGQILDWYKEAFGRDSYDGKGGRVACWQFWNEQTKDIMTGYDNAYWYSASANSDDDNEVGSFYFGYDYTGKKTWITFDICAHELTHGVTESTANLQYEGEPGALNESFSDIMAAACEFAKQTPAANPEEPDSGEADWLMTEDCTGNSAEALRSFANPSGLPAGIENEEARQPSRYCGSNWRDTAPSASDHGGVHGNSGVQNHFFYLLSEGSKGWNGVKDEVNDEIPYDEFDGIGVTNAAKIAYQVLTAYCGPRTDYRQVREYWFDAAIDMIEEDKPNGEPWTDDEIHDITNAVVKAWAAVMPFDQMEISLGSIEGFDEIKAGDSVTVVGLAKWDGEMVKTVDEEAKIYIWIPQNFDAMASSIFRINDSMIQVRNLGSGAEVLPFDGTEPYLVSYLENYKPASSDDIRITDVKLDTDEMLIVAEVKNGDQKACVNDFSPTISDLLRLRRSASPNFDDAEDLDIVKCKNPFVGDDGNPVPNKYNILLKLPKDASSGFYRLEW